MRVVLVDDESLIRMDLRDLLTHAGHEVVGEGANGVEALALAQTQQPDVILMDVKMPKLDGIEAARQIRHHRWAPVVLLTAYSQEDLVQKARESGVYGYLLKPVREMDVIPALQMAVGRFQDEQKQQEQILHLAEHLSQSKVIRRATTLVMQRYGLTEEAAYQRLRSFSMQKQIPLEKLCQDIVAREQKADKTNIVK